MEVLCELSQIETCHYEEAGISVDEGPVYEFLLCPACKRPLLRKYDFHDQMYDPEYGHSYTVLYPLAKKTPVGLPDDIESAYEAAQKVKQIDGNSFAVLIGRILEMICHQFEAEGKDLYNQIVDLHKKGHIPANLLPVAQVLREFRNVGAHAKLGSVDDSLIPTLDDLARAIIEYVYTAPFLAEKAQKRYETHKQILKLKANIKTKKKGAK
jgi:hypothetical protein